MYKTTTVKSTEPGLYGSVSSHSSMLKEAIERINAENGKITYMHTNEIPQFRSFGVGLGYSEVELTTVIVYETD